MYVSLTYNYGNLARVTGEMLSLITRKGDHGQFHESSLARVPQEGLHAIPMISIKQVK